MPQEECKGGDCPLRPQFDDPEEPEGKAPGTQSNNKKVRLSTSKYVQLLIDARETDPDCWPPGLEEAAGMVESARAIEEACTEKWGDFDPDKLSREQSRKYFEIQLALDALQEEDGDTPPDMQSALSEARLTLDSEDAEEAADQDTHTAPAPGGASSEPGGYALPTPPAPGPSEGFFARGLPIAQAEAFFIVHTGSRQAETEEDAALFLEDGWPEMPPLQRGDNYA